MKSKVHPALEQLYDIIRKEDWSSFCPEKVREEQLDKWCKNWLVDIEYQQSVLDTKYLTGEYNDIIKLKLAQSLAEDLAEECTQFKVEDRKISAQVCAFRRKEKVRGE